MGIECAGLWLEAQREAKPFHKRKEAMEGDPGRVGTKGAEQGWAERCQGPPGAVQKEP